MSSVGWAAVALSLFFNILTLRNRRRKRSENPVTGNSTVAEKPEAPVPPVPAVAEATVLGFMETGFCVDRVVFNDGSEYRRLKDTFASYPDGRLLSRDEVSSVKIAAIEFHVRRGWAEEKKQNKEMGPKDGEIEESQ